MARKHTDHEDETRYCENCGISFIWTAEEQRVSVHQVATQMPDPVSDDESLLLEGAVPPVLKNEQSTVLDGKQVAPSYCPGCRQLLPPPYKEHGLVKWYHRRKGYGFITRHGGNDLYVQRSALPRDRLAPGDLVEFALGENRRGSVAVDVKILEKAVDEI